MKTSEDEDGNGEEDVIDKAEALSEHKFSTWSIEPKKMPEKNEKKIKMHCLRRPNGNA